MKLALLIITDRLEKIQKKLPPLGLGYIASYVKANCRDTEVKIIEEDHLINLRKFNPDMIGMTSVTQHFNKSVQLAHDIKKEFNIPLFIGGYHITMLPKNIIGTPFDFAVIGEGEETVKEIIDLNKKAISNKDLNGIKGIVYFEKKLVNTGKRELISRLDEIPFPMRNQYKTVNMITSRGCPFRCVFCSSSSFWKSTRFNSPEYVVNEIGHLTKKGVKHITISDDLFIADNKRVKKIASLIGRNNIRITFSVRGRTDMINDEICIGLKKMGAISINFGIESGSQKILSYLKKDTITVEQSMRAIKLCKKYGFIVVGSFMIGNPNETRKDMMETLDFLKNAPLDDGDTYISTPLPGTEMWEQAKKEGKVSDDMDWSRLTFGRDEALLSEIKKSDLNEIMGMFRKEWKRKRRISFLKGMTLKNMRRALANPKKAINHLMRVGE